MIDDALPNLARSLQSAMRWGWEPEQWLDFKTLRATKARLRKDLDRPRDLKPTPRLHAVVAAYRANGEIASYSLARQLSYCVGLLDEHNWCILADHGLRSRLTSYILNLENDRRRIKCYRALLLSYFRFPIQTFLSDSDNILGWKYLREWLSRHLSSIAQSSERIPEWMRYLRKHPSLLEADACQEFVDVLFSDDDSRFNELIHALTIPGDSWIHDELILAPFRKIARYDNPRFLDSVERAMLLLERGSTIGHYPKLRVEALAILLSRCAKISGLSPQLRIQALALDLIGHPRLDCSSWENCVQTEMDEPDEDARRMVDRWLKLRLIRDFFELLSSDRKAAQDRIHYWTGKEPEIKDMWFVIGDTLRSRDASLFREFELNAKGSVFDMRSSTQAESAFIMHIGNYLVIEFGNVNNACFFFNWNNPPPLFTNMLHNANEGRNKKIDELKDKSKMPERVRHIHKWQANFDAQLLATKGRVPVSQPSSNFSSAQKEQWQLYCEARRILFEDRRSQGEGVRLRILHVDRQTATALSLFGFTFHEHTGWVKG
jgi:hypothetical protein